MKRFLLPVILVGLIATLYYDCRQWRLRRVDEAFNRGDFSTALAGWSADHGLPWEQAALAFNRGAAAYRMGDYAAAVENFRAVATDSVAQLRARALYNQGTTLIRIAAERNAKDPTAAEPYLKDAVKSLQAALAVNPTDEPTKGNLATAQRRLTLLLEKKGSGEKQDAAADPRRSAAKPPPTPKQPGQGQAQPGPATDLDQAGAERRPAPMDRDEALRMLDEMRGREALRTTKTRRDSNTGWTPPEKDW